MRTVGPSRAAMLAVVAVAGCFSPSPPSGAPCNPLTPNCPSGQRCTESGGAYYCLRPGEAIGDLDAGVDDMIQDTPDLDGMPDGGSDDRDNDGVLNDADNCPDDPNSEQDNDDNDAFGDECDPCPPYADVLPIQDPDGDNVSGRCDPNPSLAGDRISYFTTFRQIPGNASITGMISLQLGNGGRVTISAADGASSTLTIPEPATSTFSVITEVTGTAINLGAGSSNVAGSGPVVRKASGSDSGIQCALVVNSLGVTSLVISNLAAQTNLDTVPYTVLLDQPYTLVLTRAGASYTCSSQSGVAPSPTQIQADTPLIQNDARAGLRTQASAAIYPWLLMTDRP